MTYLKFKLKCVHTELYEEFEMFLVEDDMSWVFECPKCGKQVAVENWTMEEGEALTSTQNGKDVFSTGFSREKSVLAGGEGFEPSTPNLGEWLGTAKDWERYREYINSQDLCDGYKTTIYNYTTLFYNCVLSGDYSKVRDVRPSKRSNIVKALSHFSKFVGRYDSFKRGLIAYGIKWRGKSNEDHVLDRLERKPVWEWVKEVKQARPDLANFMDLMSYTGMRFVEGIDCYNMIIKLNQEGRLNEYYIDEKETLEHYRFKEIFLRKGKKVFVSFTPTQLVKNIVSQEPLTKNIVQTRIKREKLRLAFGDIREAQGTLMTRYLRESEINFLQGRISSSVFMSNYFNPALISDLQVRVFQGIKEIQERIA